MRIDHAVETIRTCLDAGGKVLICGNGGSAAQADHFMAEMIGSGMACVSLTNPAVITALGNDYGFDHIFQLQVGALYQSGDVLIALTTSGKSENINSAIEAAHFRGMEVIKLPAAILIGDDAQTMQETHLQILHQIWKGLLK